MSVTTDIPQPPPVETFPFVEAVESTDVSYTIDTTTSDTTSDVNDDYSNYYYYSNDW
jgi:hypothetical protein